MTNKLFYQDPYQTEFDAEVVKINENKVILSDTCFYGTNGGQLGDTGTINGEPVEMTEIENGEIVHLMKQKPSFKVGDKVHGKIDWEDRYKKMRLHSALHIIFYIFKEKMGNKEIIGSNVYSEKGRMDFKMDDAIPPEVINELQNRLNAEVEKNLPIETGVLEGDRRYWKVDGFPQMLCGGTHLKSTGEIGETKLKRKNIGKSAERIEVKLKSSF